MYVYVSEYVVIAQQAPS